MPKFFEVINWEMIGVHILSSSSSKGNHTMKYDQSTDYKVKNIFLEKLCRKLATESSSKPRFVF